MYNTEAFLRKRCCIEHRVHCNMNFILQWTLRKAGLTYVGRGVVLDWLDREIFEWQIQKLGDFNLVNSLLIDSD